MRSLRTIALSFLLILQFKGHSQCTPTISGQSKICLGKCGTLTATGATSYSWSPSYALSSSTGASVIACPSVSCNYTITGQTGTCISTAEFLVDVVPDVTATATSKSLCLNSSLTLLAGGGNTYSWIPSYALNVTNTYSVVANPTITTNYSVIVSDGGYCPDTAIAVVTVYTCSGLSELDQNPRIDIFPNPTSANFQIKNELGGEFTIEIFDLNGKLLLTRTTNETITIPTNKLTPGIYISIITCDRKRWTKRLIKE